MTRRSLLKRALTALSTPLPTIRARRATRAEALMRLRRQRSEVVSKVPNLDRIAACFRSRRGHRRNIIRAVDHLSLLDVTTLIYEEYAISLIRHVSPPVP